MKGTAHDYRTDRPLRRAGDRPRRDRGEPERLPGDLAGELGHPGRGGLAVEAVEAAIRALEDDPTFNAGVGAALNADGEVELEAAIMESSGLRCGAAAGVGRLRHPI
jgi:hypothetical protein